MSDMLLPLPQVDWNFEPCDGLTDAVGDTSPAVSPAPEGLSRPSYAAVVRGEEPAAAGRVLSSDDSWSSGNESSPGGFRKRHFVSPLQSHADKKSAQGWKGVGRGVHQPSSSNPLLHAGRVIQRGSSSPDSAVDQSRFGPSLIHI